MNKEIIKAIKSVNSIKELQEVASKNGYNLTDEEADGYFKMYHDEGKIKDNDLDNVVGGACTKFCNFKAYGGDNNLLIVSGGNSCDGFTGKFEGIDEECQHCVHSRVFSNAHSDTRYCLQRNYDDDPYNSMIGTKRIKGPNGKYWDSEGNPWKKP